MNTTATLADIIRAYHGANLSRNELKVLRAKLRRAGVTNLNHARRNSPYTVNPSIDARTDKRAVEGTIVAQVAATVKAA